MEQLNIYVSVDCLYTSFWNLH